MAAKISASRLVERSLTTAKRDPRSAARTLFKEFLAGNTIAPLPEALWNELVALADRATSCRMATPGSAAATALGDNWFQCPHCDDVFEGTREVCAACGKPLVQTPALEIVFDGDARLWIRASSAAALGYPPRIEFLASAFAWLRVESGDRWFELSADPSLLSRATARAVLPPNLVAIGTHHDGTIVLAHETKLSIVCVDPDGVVATVPDRIACAGEILARQILFVLNSSQH